MTNSQMDRVRFIRATLKRSRFIASMYRRGGLNHFYQSVNTSLEMLDKLKEELEKEKDGNHREMAQEP